MSIPREVKTQVGTAPASASEAMDMVHAGLGYLAAADPTALAAGTQARMLRMLEQATAMGTAARAAILAAFTSGQGYAADADYSPRAWLIQKTRITKGAAVGYTAWARRAAAHPQVIEALAAGEMSESYARTICGWTDKLPEDCRAAADDILLAAAKAGADVRDLGGLAAEIYARSLPEDSGSGKDEAFADRSVRLETTFDGAGVLNGDLTPECAAVVGGGRRGAGCAVSSGGSGGHPDARAADTRRAAGGDAAADRGRPAARAGRSAGQGLGPHLPRRPPPARGQFGAAGGMDQPGPRSVGRPPRRGLGRRQRRRRVAGRRRRHRDGVRRGHGPVRHR